MRVELGGVEEVDSLIDQLFEIRKAFMKRQSELEGEPDA